MSELTLISVDAHNQLSLTPEAESFLNSLAEDLSLGIICVVGKQRTGKSYLINSVLMEHSNSFKVGNSVQPCTKGTPVTQVSSSPEKSSLPPTPSIPTKESWCSTPKD